MDLGDTARAKRYAALFIVMGTLMLVLLVSDVVVHQQLEAVQQAISQHHAISEMGPAEDHTAPNESA